MDKNAFASIGPNGMPNATPLICFYTVTTKTNRILWVHHTISPRKQSMGMDSEMLDEAIKSHK